MEAPEILKDEQTRFFKYEDNKKTEESGQGSGRISNALSKAISYERTPSFFDEKEIVDRDKELKALQELKENDIALCIDRKDKPIVLTSYQSRIMHALSYAISLELGEEDVKKKISTGKDYVKRDINVTALTSLIFGSTRKRYKDIIIKEIFRLARIRQVQRLKYNDKDVKLTAPLIMVGRAMEDLSPEKQNDLDYIEVIFGSAFFMGLDKRFAVITPKLFEVWGKGGRGTELFHVLLSSIFAVYWHYRQAATKAEERVRSDKQYKNLPKEELEELIKGERRNAMTYELNVSSIKNRVTTDYDSQRSYRARFYTDLENAIEGLKELDLITDAIVQRGARGQEKVIFILSETYNFAEKSSTALPLLEEKDEGEISAF